MRRYISAVGTQPLSLALARYSAASRSRSASLQALSTFCWSNSSSGSGGIFETFLLTGPVDPSTLHPSTAHPVVKTLIRSRWECPRSIELLRRANDRAWRRWCVETMV